MLYVHNYNEYDCNKKLLQLYLVNFICERYAQTPPLFIKQG